MLQLNVEGLTTAKLEVIRHLLLLVLSHKMVPSVTKLYIISVDKAFKMLELSALTTTPPPPEKPLIIGSKKV